MNALELQQVLISLVNQIEGTGAVEFVPGQLVSVLLKEIQGQNGVLHFQGQDIPARLEVSVPAGSKLQCIVEGEQQGQIILRVVNPTADEGIGVQTLKAMAHSLDLPETPRVLAVLKEMVRQQLPLDRDVAKQLAAFNGKAAVSENDTWLPVFMKKLGIPLTRENFENCRELLTNTNYLKDDLAKIARLLSSPEMAAESKLSQLSAAVQKSIDSFVLRGTDSTSSAAQKVSEVFRQLTGQMNPQVGEDAGTKSTNVIPIIETKSAIQASTAVDTIKPFIAEVNHQKATTKPVEASTVLTAEEEVGHQIEKQLSTIIDRVLELAGKEKLFTPTDRMQLLQKMSLILDHDRQENVQPAALPAMLKQLAEALRDNGSHQHNDLIQTTQNAIGKLEFMQNFNKSGNNQEQILLLYSTIQFADREESVRLAVSYRNDRQKRPTELTACKIEVKLQTPGLGLVRCEVRVDNKKLSLQFTADNLAARTRIDNLQGHLAGRLEQMGYQVRVESCKIHQPAELQLPFGQSVPELFRVNLRV